MSVRVLVQFLSMDLKIVLGLHRTTETFAIAIACDGARTERRQAIGGES